MNRTILFFFAIAVAGLLLQQAPAFASDDEAEHETRVEQRKDALEERREKRREQKERRREQREELRRDRRSDKPTAGGAERAARMARKMNGGGRVLSVDPDGNGYRVRLLKNGEVRSYKIED